MTLTHDLRDHQFLKLAARCVTYYRLTGNALDFTSSEFGYTRILTPRAYRGECRP